jgi:hypothetical protein
MQKIKTALTSKVFWALMQMMIIISFIIISDEKTPQIITTMAAVAGLIASTAISIVMLVGCSRCKSSK